MKKILIADAGSTKIDWILLDSPENPLREFQTEGLNAVLADETDVREYFVAVKEQLSDYPMPDFIHYYGAGVATKEAYEKIHSSLDSLFPGATVEIVSDLLGAARALFGKDEGIVCIIGTGSNSGVYDGSVITDNTPSLGFILGDEGSGASLGKRFLSDLLKSQLSEKVMEDFHLKFMLTVPEVINNVYKGKRPNTFLASFVPFILSHIEENEIQTMVRSEINSFLRRNILPYKKARELDIRMVGSVAKVFETIIREEAKKLDLNVTTIVKNPIEGLIKFHKEQGW